MFEAQILPPSVDVAAFAFSVPAIPALIGVPQIRWQSRSILEKGDLLSGLKVLGKSTDGTLDTASPAARAASRNVIGRPREGTEYWSGTKDAARDELIAELLKLTAK